MFFLLLMVISFLGIFGVGIYALVMGEPGKFIAPYDANGQMCGYPSGSEIDSNLNKDVRDYPYLYFTKLDTTDLNLDRSRFDEVTQSGVCVKSCPSGTDI
jgi:hypothetical protein